MDSWLKTWRESPWAGCIPNHMFRDVTRTMIEELVLSGSTYTVACLAARPDRILGWLLHGTSPDGKAVAHCVYVKDPYVTRGVPELLASAPAGTKPGFYTHRTRQMARCFPDYKHAPEIARRKK